MIFPFISYADNIDVDLMQQQAELYRQKGYELQQNGDTESAIAYFYKAVEISPEFVEAINDLGVAYETTGDIIHAVKMYDRAITIEPSYLPAYTNLAFLYEKQGDITNAVYYWKKRYDLGTEGEYWWEVAKQHLMKIGNYPEIRRRLLEKQAAIISQDIADKKCQERMVLNEEARLKYDSGLAYFKKGDADSASHEFAAALAVNPPDIMLREEISQYYKKAEMLKAKKIAIQTTQDALAKIEKEEYIGAGEDLKSALSTVFNISKK